MESTLRPAMKNHLAILLKQHLAYWNKRGKVKRVILGEENLNSFSLHGL
jgi:hypothetical protein